MQNTLQIKTTAKHSNSYFSKIQATSDKVNQLSILIRYSNESLNDKNKKYY